MFAARVFVEAGGEILNQIINSFFSKIIDIVLSYNGDVVKFAGDAMFVVAACKQTVQPICCIHLPLWFV